MHSETTLKKSGKITTMYALFSIAAVPEEFWKDLKPADYA
jgi:hypothetical protein